MTAANGQPRRIVGWLVFLLPLISYLAFLGSYPLFDVDEGAFSEATREMFERGDFLSTYLDGEHRFDKPILIYWLQALAYLVLGPSEWAFRLPSALAAIAWSYATWQFARERFGAQTALAALLVVSTAIGPFAIGRAATADALLNLWLALSLFDAWRHLESGRRAPLLRAYVWIGLGVLTKGPIAIIVPVAVTFLYCLSRQQWRTWLRAIGDPIGWALLAVLVVPWYAAALGIHGQKFIDGFILKHNVKRFTGTLEGHTGSLFYYVLAVPLLLLPWTGPLFAACRQIRKDMATGVRRYLWVWAAFVVVFFSLSGTKLPHYALYGATPLFLLIAAHRFDHGRTWAHAIAPTVLFVLFVLAPPIFGLLAGGEAGNAFYRAQLSRAMALAGWPYYAVTIGALVLWLVLLASRTTGTWRKLAVAAVLQIAVLTSTVVPYVGQVLQGPVREAGLKARALGEPAVRMRFDAPSFSVYAQAVTPSRAPEPGELAITRIDRVPESGFDTVFAEGGVVLLRRQTP